APKTQHAPVFTAGARARDRDRRQWSGSPRRSAGADFLPLFHHQRARLRCGSRHGPEDRCIPRWEPLARVRGRSGGAFSGAPPSRGRSRRGGVEKRPAEVDFQARGSARREPTVSAQRTPGHARVLVVEDGDALRRGIVRALREVWSDVDEETSGERAVARLGDRSGEPYDVVLTDLRLPGVDGVEVLRAARDRDERTSVVLMTAFGSVETAVEAMRLGAFDFVQKPFDLEQLEARVARAVAH